MMELFLSKVWVFVVALALLGLLVQGVQKEVQADRSVTLQELADGIQELFCSIQRAGPGLDLTVHLNDLLPASVTLRLYNQHVVLQSDRDAHHMEVPAISLFIESPSGALEEVDSLKLDQGNVLRFVTDEEGTRLIALDQRTSPPGT